MSSLVELLLQTGNEETLVKIADQYGLDKTQTNDAVRALMPAFSQGLRRNSSSAQDFGAFMHALAEGDHVKYTNDNALAFTPDGINEGNQILGHLFKTKDLSRKIAEQASTNSGVSANILKQMMPSLAPIILGALKNNIQNQNAQPSAQHFGGTGGANPLGRILEELMKGGLNKTGSGGRASPRGNNPLGDILEQVLGGKGRQTGQPSSGGSQNDRLGDIFGEMLDGKSGGFNGPDFREPELREQPSQQDANPYDDSRNDPYADAPIPVPNNESNPRGNSKGGGLEDLFGEMFRPSKQEDTKYGRDVESIFDEFLGPNNR